MSWSDPCVALGPPLLISIALVFLLLALISAGVLGRRIRVAKRQYENAEARLRLAASVFSHGQQGIMITDARGRIVEVNKAFSRITGYAREEVLGRNPNLLQSGRQGPEFYQQLWAELKEQGHWTGEVWNRRKDGEVFAENLTISAVRQPEGAREVTNYVGLFSDITPQKLYQDQLERIAHFDPLTDLPNRVLLADRLAQAMTQARRHQHRVAVAYIDLDGFKAINDTHGHEVGDQFLCAVGARVRAALRAGDTVARLGGDEFVAVLIDLPEDEAFDRLMERLVEALSLPIAVGGLELPVSASVGVTFYPQAQELEPEQLLRQADQAMYQAKHSGKNRVCLYGHWTGGNGRATAT